MRFRARLLFKVGESGREQGKIFLGFFFWVKKNSETSGRIRVEADPGVGLARQLGELVGAEFYVDLTLTQKRVRLGQGCFYQHGLWVSLG